MNDTPSHISRRTLAKGAAWTIPAVSIAAAAPALTASANDCPAGPGWRDIAASRPTWSLAVAPNFGSGSRVLLNIGDITPSLNAPVGTTGFRWKPDTVTAVDNEGASYTGQILTDTDTAYTIGAGGALSAGVLFADFAYNSPGSDPDWSTNHRLESYTFTYRIQWLAGLNTILECPYTSQVEARTFGPAHLQGRLSDFR